MAFKKIKAGLKKAVKVVKAVGQGTADYSRKMKAVDYAATKTAGKSGSRVTDIKNQRRVRQTVKK